jgi:amidophosphoribosyltransferase|tara:strand:- start:404 stop:1930 length:1527 start_codon:yes stop_codon:yes gene_type:complete
MCGLVGVVTSDDVGVCLYDTLTVLQHRGQDAAGIMTCDNRKLNLRKDNGLVKDVFSTRHMRRLTGQMGIGHVRYPTAGGSSPALAQPFYVNSPYGISLAHNGNLTNSAELSRELFKEDLRHMNTDSDSEVLLNVFAHELRLQGKIVPGADDVFAAVAAVNKRCRGGYVAVAMITGYGIVGFRDPNGIRPLVFGSRITDSGKEYMMASESVALDSQGFTVERDVAPGEAIYIDINNKLHSKVCSEPHVHAPCIFEHVYFARPDSFMDGISVYKARLRMGEKLGDKLLKLRPDHDIDVVIPIPDTSRTSALELANRLGLKYREGFVKNRYIGRTFIMPGQKQRQKSVRQKLNAIDLEFRGKTVLLVDDSIVRGTTCKQIIQMARDAGAKKVYFASAAPAIRYPNVYGIDMPSASELIAAGKTDEEVQELIGADWLIYQDLSDLIAAASEGNPDIERFECSVFDGDYVTAGVDEVYLKRLENTRKDSAKKSRKKNGQSKQQNLVADFHNDS